MPAAVQFLLFFEGARLRVYFLYSFLTGVALVATLPYWLFRGLRQGKYLHNIWERLGVLPRELPALLSGRPKPIWIHAVSVGEVLAAAPLARALKEMHGERPLVVSTTTQTGQRLARERMDFADGFFYFPLDWSFCVRRVFRALRPSAVIVLETEIWPNFLRCARQAGVPVVFANGRISSQSFRRYQKWLRLLGAFLRPFLRRVLADASLFLMQTQEDAGRIVRLGAPPEKVTVTGNLKYDQGMPAETPIVSWLEDEVRRKKRRPVIVAGSVVANEEPLVLSAFGMVQREWPRALLLLAPRKPERFDASAGLIEESRRHYIRRSDVRTAKDLWIPDDVSVVLLDTIGELAGLYRLADAVFVGGSLVPAGGHNLLEPSAFGKVPVFGPSTENFQEIAGRLLDAGAALRVYSPEELGVEWVHLLRDNTRPERMGAAAGALVERSRGATARTLEHINAALEWRAEAAAVAAEVAKSGVMPAPRAARSRE